MDFNSNAKSSISNGGTISSKFSLPLSGVAAVDLYGVSEISSIIDTITSTVPYTIDTNGCLTTITSDNTNKEESMDVRSSSELNAKAKLRIKQDHEKSEQKELESIKNKIREEERQKELEEIRDKYTPRKVLYNGDVTIVFWKDNTKTIVKKMKGVRFNKYQAFTAALAKKILLHNNAIMKIVESGEVQK